MPDKTLTDIYLPGVAHNFCGIPSAGVDARYHVLPVPYDLTTSYVTGTRGGPRAIIEASTHMELYDADFGCEPSEAGIHTLAEIEPTALGPEVMVRRVREAVDAIIGTGDASVPVILGGEHSITLGAVESLLDHHPGLSVLQLDAHADMRDEYMESPYNHACVARRISERCPIVQTGIRSLCSDEAAFLATSPKGVTTHYAAETIKAVATGQVDQLLKGLTDTIYITVDIDAFDPSVMPATGTPEPGGLGWYDVLAIIERAARTRRVVGFDVMELAPQSGNVAPDFLAAKLVYKMMAFVNSSIDKLS